MSPGGRFVYFLLAAGEEGHIQSLILARSLLTGGLVSSLLGILADLLAANRCSLEELVWRDKAVRHGLLESTHGNGTMKGASAGLFEEPAPIEHGRLVTSTYVRGPPTCPRPGQHVPSLAGDTELRFVYNLSDTLPEKLDVTALAPHGLRPVPAHPLFERGTRGMCSPVPIRPSRQSDDVRTYAA